MKPAFALSLSFEGIALLHRAAGGWRRVGEVPLDSEDLRADLARLRECAGRLAPGPLQTKVIIPNDQVRYLSVDTGRFTGPAQEEMVRAAVTAATPYALEDLAYDTCPDGDRTHVAAVLRQTLAEAESFAAEHGFGPVSFVAAPGENPFLGEPFFGKASLAEGIDVEADGVAVVVIGNAVLPAPPAQSVPSFSSRRIRHLAAAYAVAEEPEAQPRITLVTVAEGDEAATAEAMEPDPAEPEVAEPVGAEADAPHGDGEANATEPETGAAEAPVTDAVVTEAEPVPGARIDLDEQQASESGDTEAEPAPVTAAVTAPAIVIDDEPEEAPAEGFAAFLSRRSRPAHNGSLAPRPRPQVGPAVPPGPTLPAPRAITAPLPPRQVPKDEAGRMTVFGARNSEPSAGGGRRAGLIMTGAVAAVLAVGAVWAGLFMSDGSGELADQGAETSEIALAVPAEAPAPTVPVPAPAVLSDQPAQPEAPAESAIDTAPQEEEAPLETTSPAAPALSPTDAAVLDALREAVPDETPGAEPQDTETGPDIETALAEPVPSASEALSEPVPDATRYAATGIWPNAPDVPETPAIIGIDDLYIASIDRTDLSQDAIALAPPAELDTDKPPAIVTSPAAAGTEFALDSEGLVEPTPEGTMNPEGVLVYLGPPPNRPPDRPAQAEFAPQEVTAEQARLASVRPRLRPDDLSERAERQELGGLTRAELAAIRPKMRPASLSVASAAPSVPEVPAAEETAEPFAAVVVGSGSALAVATSPRPDARPKGFASLVARARPATPQPDEEADADGEPESAAVVASAAVSPRIPSSASVARQATLENAINLRQLNLIGVYGTPSNRRALIRLPTGRYKKVQVGDTVDGGRVVAIGDGELRYQKGGRNLTLKVPSG